VPIGTRGAKLSRWISLTAGGKPARGAANSLSAEHFLARGIFAAEFSRPVGLQRLSAASHFRIVRPLGACTAAPH